MRLSDFILANAEQIIVEWEKFAVTLPVAHNMNRVDLRDHIKEILEFVVQDIDCYQSALGQSEKSKGRGPEAGGRVDSAAQTHASLRSSSGFDMAEMASEYRALRASIVKLWMSELSKLEQLEAMDLIRFNEAIDQALMESVARFKDKIDTSKDMFIGILGHDLRTPLGAIAMSSQLLLGEGDLNEEQISLVSQIENSAERMNQMITDILDLTRITLGSGIPITPNIMDMGSVGRQSVEEVEAFHSNRTISFEAIGNLEGQWDSARISQVFSNLISNAVQHGFKKSPIAVKVTGQPDEIIITVHNEGIPIPQANLETIFNSLTRVVKKGETQKETTSLGLGLYIAKEIVIAHGGTIDVTSSEKEGTTFTVRLPRVYKQVSHN